MAAVVTVITPVAGIRTSALGHATLPATAAARVVIVGMFVVTGAVPARCFGALAVQFNPSGTHLSSTTEHAAHSHPLVNCQCRALLTDNYRVVAQGHIDASHYQAPLLPALHQPFDYYLMHSGGKRHARIGATLGDFQLATGPLTTHEHFLRCRYPASQLQPLKATRAVHHANGAGLLEARCSLDTAGNYLATGIAQAADLDRFTRSQAFCDSCALGQVHGLAHYSQWRGGIWQLRQRAFVNVQDRNASSLKASLAGERLHRHYLPDCQVGAAGCDAIFTHRYIFAVMHLHAIDAD